MGQTRSYLGITIHEEAPAWLNECGMALLSEGYLKENESPQEAFARAATAYCYGDYTLAQRIYNYAYNNWFMFATPVLSNAPKGKWVRSDISTCRGWDAWRLGQQFVGEEVKGLPISCYAFNIPDTLLGQVDTQNELAELSFRGGGTGGHVSIRAPSKKAPGPIPYMKVLDSTIGYYRQQGRRGSLAVYMDVDHPTIAEHIRFRLPTGDAKLRSDNRQQMHNAVNLTDEFIEAVLEDKTFNLKCPHSGEIYETVKARDLWEEILETRSLTGEPYLFKIDAANRRMPETQKQLGLKIRGSNLCSEITLPTDEERTFVCCLSSLNIERFDEWKDSTIVEDLVRYLDNVLQFFIDNAPDSLSKAKYSAERERALGIGALGMHAYLQSKSIPIEGGGFGSSVQQMNIIFKNIKEKAVSESKKLAAERGEAPDMIGTGLRNSRLLAIAPNASSAKIANTSPSCEPWYRNIFTQATRVGNFTTKNRHLEATLSKYGMNTEEVWESIKANEGSVQHLDWMSEHDKNVYKTAIELDMHWIIILADARGPYVCQAQSLNTFFPSGVSREYVNSVHLLFLKSKNVYTLYYFRTEREGVTDNVKKIERQALSDWKETDESVCKNCEG
jgi:ribonucleoside-diphosphate reductase alpha chain